MEVIKLWSVFLCGEIDGAFTQKVNRVRLTTATTWGHDFDNFQIQGCNEHFQNAVAMKIYQKKLNNVQRIKTEIYQNLRVFAIKSLGSKERRL